MSTSWPEHNGKILAGQSDPCRGTAFRLRVRRDRARQSLEGDSTRGLP